MDTVLKSKKLSKSKLKSINRDIIKAHHSFEVGLEKRALYKTSDVELSQDLVQMTFLKTLLFLQKGGKVDVMRSFLNHILGALIIDEYRKSKTTSLDLLLEKGFELAFDDSERAMDVFEGKEIILLIPFLPNKYQSVLRMRFLQSLSLKEMSLLTGQSENTLAVQVHRGLAKLKVLYEESHNVLSNYKKCKSKS